MTRFLEAKDKSYYVELKLGTKTDSGDLTGNVIAEKEVKELTEKEIKRVLSSFLGKSFQVPPMYSAIKINGKKLYELARKGQEVERKPREIEISRIELVEYKDNVITFNVDCSVGTYVRTLGEDIAIRLGTVGHLIALRRTRIGKFVIEDAIQIEDINEDNGLTILKALEGLPIHYVNKEEEILARTGRPLRLMLDAKYVLIVNGDNVLIAIYYLKDNNEYRCLRGFNL